MSNSSYSYTPSAPPMPDPYGNSSFSSSSSSTQPEYYGTTSSHGTSTSTSSYPPPSQSSYYQDQGYPSTTPPSASSYPSPYGYGYGYGQQHQQQISFPPGTDPEIIRVYQVVDRDGSGFIDDTELQKALSSSGYYHFNIRTIRLLMFLFKNPQDASLRVGPKEFAALWKCLGEWRAIFQRFDKDRSGKIDATELRDALYSLGYAVPASVLQLLASHYDDGSRRKVELNFDSFIECGMIIKGLTEKFKEKDKSYTGSATLAYETFLTMVLPFLVTYD